jgi:hypothetical protein
VSAPTLFDGITISPALDNARLSGLLSKVHAVLLDGQWHTLAELHERCGGSEAGISARLRDLRKEKFGAHNVERERVAGGLWQYRMKG